MSLVRKRYMKNAIEPKLSVFASLWGMCQRFSVNAFFLVHSKPVIMELYFIFICKKNNNIPVTIFILLIITLCAYSRLAHINHPICH